MEVGVFFAFRNPPPLQRQPGRLYADILEQIRLVDEAGFDGVWLGEHHFTDDGFLASPLTVAAAAAAVTNRVQIGTYVLLLPQHHPLRLAEAATAVDLVSDGRLILGLGLGYRPSELTAVGLDSGQRGDLMDEALEVLVGCFTQERYSFDGRYFDLDQVTMTPRPLQQPMPRIILGGQGRRMLHRSARFGCAGLALAPDAALQQRHAEILREHGRDPATQRYYGMALGFVAGSERRAWELAERPATWEWEHYNQWFVGAGLPPQFPHGVRQDFVIGTPAQWIAAVERQLTEPAAVRCDHLVVQLTMSGMAHRDVMASIELFATEVLPALHAM